MKKGIMITAIVLLAAGAMIFVGGLFAGGKLPPVTYEAKSYAVNEPFTDICVDTYEMNIELIPSADGTCSVAAAETEKYYVNVSVQDGVLTVKTVDERTWIDRLFMSADQPLQIRLPGKAYQTLTIESHTGDVEVPDGFSFESIRISASTGDIACGASASGPVAITATTGDIAVENVKADTVVLSVSTGRVNAVSVSCTGDLQVTVSTGRTTLKDVACKNLITKGGTGDITMVNVIAAETVSIERSTGDVRFEQCDAQALEIRTDTGDVTGSLLSSKIFFAKSDTGRIEVPDSTSGGTCRITTDTGDIRIATP